MGVAYNDEKRGVGLASGVGVEHDLPTVWTAASRYVAQLSPLATLELAKGDRPAATPEGETQHPQVVGVGQGRKRMVFLFRAAALADGVPPLGLNPVR